MNPGYKPWLIEQIYFLEQEQTTNWIMNKDRYRFEHEAAKSHRKQEEILKKSLPLGPHERYTNLKRALSKCIKIQLFTKNSNFGSSQDTSKTITYCT